MLKTATTEVVKKAEEADLPYYLGKEIVDVDYDPSWPRRFEDEKERVHPVGDRPD
jgi:hypothetical protein